MKIESWGSSWIVILHPLGSPASMIKALPQARGSRGSRGMKIVSGNHPQTKSLLSLPAS